MIRTIVLSLAAVLMLSGTSHASFVFNFAQSAVNVQINGSESVDLIATNTGGVADTLTSFLVGINQTSASLGGNILPLNSTVNGTTPTAFAAGESIVVASFTFTAPSATFGETAEFTGFPNNNFTATSTGVVLNLIPDLGSLTVTAVPEPTSLIMFGSVVGLGLLRRRR